MTTTTLSPCRENLERRCNQSPTFQKLCTSPIVLSLLITTAVTGAALIPLTLYVLPQAMFDSEVVRNVSGMSLGYFIGHLPRPLYKGMANCFSQPTRQCLLGNPPSDQKPSPCNHSINIAIGLGLGIIPWIGFIESGVTKHLQQNIPFQVVALAAWSYFFINMFCTVNADKRATASHSASLTEVLLTPSTATRLEQQGPSAADFKDSKNSAPDQSSLSLVLG